MDVFINGPGKGVYKLCPVQNCTDNMCSVCSEGGARRRELLDKAISDQIRDY